MVSDPNVEFAASAWQRALNAARKVASLGGVGSSNDSVYDYLYGSLFNRSDAVVDLEWLLVVFGQQREPEVREWCDAVGAYRALFTALTGETAIRPFVNAMAGLLYYAQAATPNA